MKKHLLLLLILGYFSTASAQGISDALRYSNESIAGTARYNAMSGAFGALGGDLSAIAINPAGSAVFLNNYTTFTFSVNDVENEASYFNNNSSSGRNDYHFNQLGTVFVFNSYGESKWKKFTLGLNYNNTNAFEDDLFVSGNNTNNSIGNFFLEQAQGIPLELLELQEGETLTELYSFLGETEGVQAQNALLGFQGFIIDPVLFENGNTDYISNVGAGNFNQEYSQASSGTNGKYTFNLAAQYGDDLFLGLNLNSHLIDYDENKFISEINNNQGGFITRIDFSNQLRVNGAGFSAQFGGISKIQDNIRLGFTYDTPTWYVISEETTQSLITDRIENNNTISEFIDPNVINIFQDYKLRTPSKIAVSGAYIFGKKGLLSVDYSYKDFSNIRFKEVRGNGFSDANNFINNNFKAVSIIKIGGEYRLDNFSLRGGLNYEDSPYKDDKILGARQGYSLGVGYNFGDYNFDIAYASSSQDRAQQLYNIGLTDSASIETKTNTIFFTLGFKL